MEKKEGAAFVCVLPEQLLEAAVECEYCSRCSLV